MSQCYLGTKIQKIFVFLLFFWLTYQVILAKLCLLRLFVGLYCGVPLTHCFVPNWGPNGSLFIIWPVSRLPTSLSSKLRSSSLHLLAPKVRQKLLSLLLWKTTDRRSTVEVRKLSTLWENQRELLHQDNNTIHRPASPRRITTDIWLRLH